MKLANNILRGNGFTSCSQAPFYPDVVRTPVYPLFIAALYFIFGESLQVIAIVQVLLDVITCVLIFYISKRIFNQTIGFMSAIFYAIGMTNVGLAVLALSETLFTFLVTLIIYYLSKYMDSRKFSYLLFIGFFWGGAVLCRPIGLFSIPIIFILILWLNKSRWKKAIIHATFVLFLGLLVISPWIWRNHTITGHFTLSTVLNYDLLAYNSVFLKSYLDRRNENKIASELLKSDRGQMPSCINDYSHLDNYKEKSNAILLKNPITYIFIHLKANWHNLIPGVNYIIEIYGLNSGNKGTVAVLNNQGLFKAIDHYLSDQKNILLPFIPWVFVWCVFLLFTVWGMIILVRKKAYPEIILLILFGIYFILIPGPMSSPRFIAPATPFFAILAGLGIYSSPFFKNIRKFETD